MSWSNKITKALGEHMYVCIVSQELHPPWNEGMKNMIKDLIESLRKYANLDVVGVSSGDKNYEPWKGVFYAKPSRINGIGFDPLLHARMSLLAYKLNKSNAIDLFHIGFASHTFLSLFLKFFLKKPIIAHFFGGIRHRKLLRSLNTPSRIDAYITSSFNDLSSFPFDFKKIKQINPPIDSDAYKPLDKALAREYFNLPKDDFICAYLGNFNETRFPLRLLNKILEIKKRKFKLLIVSRSDIKLNIHNKNIIIKRGDLKKKEMMYVYNAPDVFIFPFKESVLYHGDGTVIDPPLTMLEAMSCGKPVIASNVTSIPYIIKDGVNGFLVEPNDLEGFRQKIIEVMEEVYDVQKIGRNAREKIIRDFHPRKIALEVKKVYEEVMENAS